MSSLPTNQISCYINYMPNRKPLALGVTKTVWVLCMDFITISRLVSFSHTMTYAKLHDFELSLAKASLAINIPQPIQILYLPERFFMRYMQGAT